MRRAAGCAALGAVLLLCAATFAMQSFYLPGFALLVLGAGFAAWVGLAGWGVKLVREPGPAAVEENQPWPLRIVVSPGLVPPPGGEIAEPLLSEPIALSRVPAAAGRARRLRVEIRFGRRGRRTLEPCRLVIRDPLGLAERTLEYGGGERTEVLVLPRIQPVVPVDGGGGAPGTLGRGPDGGEDAGAARASSAELELDVLRPYRPGTPFTRIHWPTLARTGQLMERRLIADPRARPLLVVDSCDPDSEEALDDAVRAAASLAWHLGRGGGCGVLLPGDRRATLLRPDLRTFGEIHARLALLEESESPPGITGRPGRNPVIWVTAARDPAVPARLGWIVAPHDVAGLTASFRVAGCTGFRLHTGRLREAA